MKKRNFLLASIFVLVAGVICYKLGQTHSSSTVISRQENILNCPYEVNAGQYKEAVLSGNETEISAEPIFLNESEVVKVNKPFNMVEFESGLYKIGGEKGWTSEEFDVTGDGKPETIFSGNVAMNHTPHFVNIVKDGNIIFEEGGANITLEPFYDGKGFVLEKTVDWNTGEHLKTRYVYIDDGFKPIWTQKLCWIHFE